LFFVPGRLFGKGFFAFTFRARFLLATRRVIGVGLARLGLVRIRLLRLGRGIRRRRLFALLLCL
jgi:hypothetical protein